MYSLSDLLHGLRGHIRDIQPHIQAVTEVRGGRKEIIKSTFQTTPFKVGFLVQGGQEGQAV